MDEEEDVSCYVQEENAGEYKVNYVLYFERANGFESEGT